MSIFTVLSFLSANVYLFFIAYSLYLSKSAWLNRIFALFAAALCIWAYAYTFMLAAPSAGQALFWRQVSAVGFCIFYAAFLHFTLILTKQKRVLAQKWIYPLLYLPAAVFLVNLVFAGGMSVHHFVHAYNAWIYIPALRGFWNLGYNIYFLVYLFLSLGLLIRWYGNTRSPMEKKQARIILITTLASLLLAAYTDLYFPVRGIIFPPVGVILILIPAFGTWRAITKYKMLVLTPAYAADHILSTMGEPVLVHDAAHTLKFANAAAEKLFGYARDEFLLLTPDQLYREEILTELEEKKCLKDRESYVTAKDGSIIPVTVSSSFIRDEKGEIAGIVCVLHDMTRRRKSEEALRIAHEELEERVEQRTAQLRTANDSLHIEIRERRRMEAVIRGKENQLRLITDNMLDMIAQFDEDAVFIFVSPSHQDVLGYHPEELLGQAAFDYIHPADLPKLSKRYKSGISNLKAVREEYRFRHAGGHYVWLESIANFVSDGEGDLEGVVVCSRDVTARRQMEERLSYLSMFDLLTGLYNRNYFEQEMYRLNKQCNAAVGVIICDVDGLKLINDSLGHETGDKLLKEAAHVIRRCFRRRDMIARVGGDEFAVLLPETSAQKIEEAIRRIKDAVEKYNRKEEIFPISLSVGYSMRENAAEPLIGMYRRADDQMYREKLHRSKSVRSAVSHILKKALEARDFVTEGHAARLEFYVDALARKLGLPEHTICDLRLLAQFHDIGKVGIMDKILFKPGELTANETKEMQRHSEIGHRIALSAPDLAPLADWILKHHEWWNGSGYPMGLKGEEIPLECRILAIADSYDAMTHDRPYRKAMSKEDAVKELKKYKGIQFDPNLVDVFIEMINSARFHAQLSVQTQ